MRKTFIKGFTKGEPLTALGSQQRGTLLFCFHCTLVRKTLIKGFTKGEPLTALGSQQRGPCFLLPQYPSAEDFYKGFYKGRTFYSSEFSTEGTQIFASAVPYHCGRLFIKVSTKRTYDSSGFSIEGAIFLHPQYPTTEDFIKGFTKGEPLTALGSEQRGPWFLHLQYPTAEGFWRENRQQLQVHCRWDLNFCRQDCSHELVLVFYSPISSLSHILCFLLLCQEGVWKSSSMESGWHKMYMQKKINSCKKHLRLWKC